MKVTACILGIVLPCLSKCVLQVHTVLLSMQSSNVGVRSLGGMSAVYLFACFLPSIVQCSVMLTSVSDPAVWMPSHFISMVRHRAWL